MIHKLCLFAGIATLLDPGLIWVSPPIILKICQSFLTTNSKIS
jgi:hypothetical protein